MQAVILAGGQGTRLRPLTLACPKPLLPVANVPIIRRIIDKMPPDVDEVILAVNYKLEQLEAYFAAHDVGRTVTIVEEKEPLGTAGALKNVARHLKGTFLVFNGDVLDSLDVDALRKAHRDARASATLALWRVPDPRHFGVVDVTGAGRIRRFVEKPETREDAPTDLANAGTYVLEPEVLDLVPEGQMVSIERETFPALIASGKVVHGFPFDGFWVDCGRPETFLRANEAILRGQDRDAAWGAGTARRDALVDDWAVVGDRCTLGDDVEIARSVLFDDVLVGNNVIIKDSIVGSGVVIGDDAALVDCVVGEKAHVDKGVLLKNVRLEPDG